jgi:hypothetical protein
MCATLTKSIRRGHATLALSACYCGCIFAHPACIQYTSRSAQDKYSDHTGKFLEGPSADAYIGTRVENYRILGFSVFSSIHIQGGFSDRPRV